MKPIRTGDTLSWWGEMTRMHPATLPIRRAGWFESICAGGQIGLVVVTLLTLGWLVFVDWLQWAGAPTITSFYKTCAACYLASVTLALVRKWMAWRSERKMIPVGDPHWLDMLVFHLREAHALKSLPFHFLGLGCLLHWMSTRGWLMASLSLSVAPFLAVALLQGILMLFVRRNRFHPQAWTFRIPDWLLRHAEARTDKENAHPGGKQPQESASHE